MLPCDPTKGSSKHEERDEESPTEEEEGAVGGAIGGVEEPDEEGAVASGDIVKKEDKQEQPKVGDRVEKYLVPPFKLLSLSEGDDAKSVPKVPDELLKSIITSEASSSTGQSTLKEAERKIIRPLRKSQFRIGGQQQSVQSGIEQPSVEQDPGQSSTEYQQAASLDRGAQRRFFRFRKEKEREDSDYDTGDELDKEVRTILSGCSEETERGVGRDPRRRATSRTLRTTVQRQSRVSMPQNVRRPIAVQPARYNLPPPSHLPATDSPNIPQPIFTVPSCTLPRATAPSVSHTESDVIQEIQQLQPLQPQYRPTFPQLMPGQWPTFPQVIPAEWPAYPQIRFPTRPVIPRRIIRPRHRPAHLFFQPFQREKTAVDASEELDVEAAGEIDIEALAVDLDADKILKKD